MIKYNVKTVNDWLYNSNLIKGMYYNGRRVYRRFVANGQPTPPTPSFDGKWKATYLDGHVESAECGSSSEIVRNEINKKNLVSVEIGNCATSIGTQAFYGCGSLSSVTIPNSVTTINAGVFDGCTSLSNITIPDSITSIGNSAFDSCTSLTSCTIGSGVTTIGNSAFQSCTSLTSIDIPSSVTSIGNNFFNNCSSLSSVTFGSGLTTIGKSVFNQCRNVTTITSYAVVPPSVGSRAFGDIIYTVTDVYVPDESINSYKAASGWNVFNSRIKSISEKPQ